MPTVHSDSLYLLIKSLTKAEKRNFKLFANRIKSNKDGLYIQMFDFLEKAKIYNEEKVNKRFSNLKPNDISNLKRHLYTQILKSLRLIHTKKDVDLQVREQLDNAKILYGKGLYLQSLKILQRIRELTKSSEQEIMNLEVLEFQKLIESRHITRSRKIENKVESLIRESKKSRKLISRTSHLSSLSLKIQGLYIKLGFVKNDMEKFLVEEYYESNKPDPLQKNAGFYEEVLWNQSLVWHHYMLMNFDKSLDHSIAWVDVFDRNESMQIKDPSLYIRGMHYVLTNNFYLQNQKDYKAWLKRYEQFNEKHGKDFDATTQILNFNYLYNAKINSLLLSNEYKQALTLIPEIIDAIEHFKMKLDSHRSLIFFYKIAWLYIAVGDYQTAIDYLNKVIYKRKDHLRSDIVSYAKLLHLMCHYHQGNYKLIANLTTGVKRSLELSNEYCQTTQAILAFLNKNPNSTDQKAAILKLNRKLMKTYSESYEKRCHIYFNFIGWTESLTENQSMYEYYS